LENNRAKGQNSFDITTGNVVVEFFNRNITPYPTEAGGPKFDLVPVTKQKDIMVNVARMHGQQEYDRIMALVAVLQQQAESVRRRLEITDWVHAAKYGFQIYHGQCYWLAHDLRHGGTLLTQTGHADWTTGVPCDWEYICRVKWLGDYTWVEVDTNGHNVV
jgi:hypothetical protein